MSLNEDSETCNFLHDLHKLPEKNELLKLYLNLQEKLTVDLKFYVDGTQLHDELLSTEAFLANETKIDVYKRQVDTVVLAL